MNLSREYDSESGAHLNDVIAYLDSGPNLVNHIDHCNWSVWGMGYTNHDESMYDTEVNALTNGWMNPWVIDVSCSNGDLALNDCFAEAWLRAGTPEQPHGAIAMYSASK